MVKKNQKNKISWCVKMYEIQRAVSINKVLLKHSHAYSFPSVYVCFHGTVTELRSGPVDCTALKALNIYYRSLSRWSEPTPVLDRQVPPVDCESQEQGQCWLSHVWPALALGPHTVIIRDIYSAGSQALYVEQETEA